jgi:hypothetical protein
MDTLDTEVIIDAQGNIVEMVVGGQAIPPGLFDSFGGAGGGSLLSGFGSGQLLGPELPEQAVSVGSAWTTEVDETTFGIRVRSVSEHRITAQEVVAGRETFRIETTTTTEPISFSFEDLISGLAGDPALLELAGDPSAQAELQAGMAMFEAMGIEMDYTMDRSVAETTTWFDAAAGLMVRMEMTMPQRATMSMRGIPDAGDLTMDMDMTMTAAMQLTTG